MRLNIFMSCGAFAGLLICCLFSAATALCGEAARESIKVGTERPVVKLIANVVYAQKAMRGYSNVALKMDILQPEAQKGLPVILFITGGGLINANKDNFLQQRLDLAEAGFVVASIEYRVAPTVLFPAPLEDVKSAIRYLKANAERFGADAERFGVFGASAGGYLASLAGTTSGMRQFDAGENLDRNSDVQAVVNFYGLSDLTLVGEGYPEDVVRKHASPAATEALWVNGASPFYAAASIMDTPEKAAAANPITYIGPNTPPFLIMHGDADGVVSPRQTERLHEALTAAGVDSTYYVVEGAGHGGAHWAQPAIMRLVVDFFAARLR